MKPFPTCTKSVRIINKSGIFFFLAAKFGERARTSLLKAKKKKKEIKKSNLQHSVAAHDSCSRGGGWCVFIRRPESPTVFANGRGDGSRAVHQTPPTSHESGAPSTLRSRLRELLPAQYTHQSRQTCVVPPSCFSFEPLTAAAFFCRSQNGGQVLIRFG